MLSVLLLLMALLSTAMTQLSQCTDLGKLSNIVQGQRLIGNTFLSLELKGVMHCAQACLNRKRCKSFSLYVEFGQCELNLNTSLETGSLSPSAPFIYSDIEPWTKAVSRKCEDHTCSYSQMCQGSLPNLCQECTDVAQCGACYPVTEVASTKFRSYGCYESNLGIVLRNFLANFKPVDYTNITKTVLDCANAALNSGYEFFGIEDYGLCYGGDSTEANFQTPVVLGDCGNKCWGGVGVSNTMFVFQWI